jgi:hypothetical protein
MKPQKTAEELSALIIPEINAANPKANALTAGIFAQPGKTPNWTMTGYSTRDGTYQPVVAAIVEKYQDLYDLA